MKHLSLNFLILNKINILLLRMKITYNEKFQAKKKKNFPKYKVLNEYFNLNIISP